MNKMREILFRGKAIRGAKGVTTEKKYKKDIWVFGDICHLIYDPPLIDQKNGDPLPVDPETVGQFTGSTDKNGKKIFEGDIGRYKQTDGAKINGKPIICIGKVVYNKKTASFAVDSKDEIGAKNYDYFPIKDFEIIGNIHDNPELLEGEEK